MKFNIIAILFLFLSTTVYAQRPSPDQIPTDNGELTIQPIQHGTLVLSWNGTTVYVDATGGAEAFEGIAAPDIILITHAHGDHMNIESLQALDTEDAVMIVPQSVADELPGDFSDQLVILANSENTDQSGISVRAVPMYNLPDDDDSRHPKGWGNGYVLNVAGKNVYISGDTEGIPEMRSLENIDVAFVCMNLPYTMDVNQAASAVLDFEPTIIYPYHYRGQDTEKFKELVNTKNESIEVRLKDWYPGD
ncbi:MBL fold metallo-hydrolase [Aliifodinibius sp. S!AR15-10]|uniref:MBL fold metallo-hydrolase n=1 Tax=Aliifodinibius sp. S!AR15-10 TaxID=2950437 RepID=UPI00285747A0|nr:MBL fold metallo-hydrolase [Aliifodinibius sp. S!AR15-10]MDR8393205.1 MBL fold metallo-hydrolase [Aliifodinibius sp. S!AR15-10]